MEDNRAVLLARCFEDWRLSPVGERDSDSSHKIVIRVVPNLYLDNFYDLLLHHINQVILSWPFKVYLTIFVLGRQNG